MMEINNDIKENVWWGRTTICWGDIELKSELEWGGISDIEDIEEKFWGKIILFWYV